VLAEVLGCLDEQGFESCEFRHRRELVVQATENPGEQCFPLSVLNQALVEPVHELRRHRVLVRVAQLVITVCGSRRGPRLRASTAWHYSARTFRRRCCCTCIGTGWGAVPLGGLSVIGPTE